MGIAIGNWDWSLEFAFGVSAFGNRMVDSDCWCGLGIVDWDWELGLGIRIGIGDGDWKLEFGQAQSMLG